MTIAKKQLSYVFFAAALVVSCWLLVVGQVNAQTAPEFLISWRAVNYVPSDYQGKALPSNGSTIEMSFDVIDRNRIANLSQNEIRWFVNGELAASGAGLKRFNFTLQNRRDQTVRIVVLGHNDTELERTIIIPFTEPEVVVEIFTPLESVNNRIALQLKDYVFRALPFFFNANNRDQLQFSWRVNGQPIANIVPDSEDILFLSLQSDDLPLETELSISIGIRNTLNQLELGSRVMYFLVR